MEKNIIPVAFSFDEKFFIGAYITIFSLLSNAKKTTQYKIYFLLDLDKFNKSTLNKFYELADIFNTKITIIEVNNNQYNFKDYGRYSIEVYNRLLIPWLIKNEDKILYLDVDLIINDDLYELYNINIENYLIGASLATDVILEIDNYIPNFFENFNLNKDEYINSGVLLINSKKFRELNLLDDLLNKTKHNFPAVDQDILNIVCENQKYILNKNYNVTYGINYFINKYSNIIDINDFVEYYFNPIIFHYTDYHKPWNFYYPNSEMHNKWWEYYKKSPIFNEKYFYQKMAEYFEQRKKIEYEFNLLEQKIQYYVKNNDNIMLNNYWFSLLSIFGIQLLAISNNSNYIRFTILGIKLTFSINDKIINKMAWWIPIKSLRNNFRAKFKIADQTRPDQTRPDLIFIYVAITYYLIILLNNNRKYKKIQPMLQYKIAA